MIPNVLVGEVEIRCFETVDTENLIKAAFGENTQWVAESLSGFGDSSESWLAIRLRNKATGHRGEVRIIQGEGDWWEFHDAWFERSFAHPWSGYSRNEFVVEQRFVADGLVDACVRVMRVFAAFAGGEHGAQALRLLHEKDLERNNV